MKTILETVYRYHLTYDSSLWPNRLSGIKAFRLIRTQLIEHGFRVDPLPIQQLSDSLGTSDAYDFSITVSHHSATAITLFLLSHTLPKGYTLE